MRVIRVDLAKTLDANGAGIIPVKLPVTGSWVNAKLSLTAPASAEWAVVVSGTPVTYGRGRRVTLGPEVIQDGETVSVQITGGPPGGQVTGSLNGKAGTPEEVLADYAPQPNTIALDTTSPRQALTPQTVATTKTPPSFQVASGGLSGAKIFTISPGTIAMRIMVTANGLLFGYRLLVLGRESGVQYFGAESAPGSVAVVPSPTLPITVPVDTEWDQHIEIHVENPTQNVDVYVSALNDVEAPGQAGAAQSVIIPTPAPWQAPRACAVVGAAIAGGANLVVVAAVASQTVYVFPFQPSIDAAVATGALAAEDTSGVAFYQFNMGSIIMNAFLGAGVPMTAGLGVRLHNLTGGPVTIRGGIPYTQA